VHRPFTFYVLRFTFYLPRLTSIVLLLLFWGRVLVNVRDQSPVVDEPVHVTRAVAYWRTGDLRLQQGHTPLSHAWSGAFLALEPDLPSPAGLKGWERASRTDVTRYMLLEPERPVERALFLGRWANLALGMALSALVCRWAGERFGREAGLAALFVITFDPNILAHSGLVTTDLPVACLTYAACYAFSRWLDRPTAGRLLLAGLTLGLAWGAKLSALILLPVLGLALLWHVWRQRESLWGWLVKFAALLGVGILTLWAVYRFEAGVWPPAGAWVPMPTHWDNLRRLWQHQAQGHRAFFAGQLSDEGWWSYFPVLFLIKTPLPTLILLIVAIVIAWRKKPGFWTEKTWFLIIIFPILYFAVSVASSINIGYRHILPVVPFAVTIAASAFHPPLRGQPALISHFSILISLWMALSSLWIHPYYLAYFNELVGGPDRGYRYAVDSNLDWGQDLKRLKAYLDERGIGHVKLSYFGMAKPEQYGIEYDPLPMPSPSTPADFTPFNPAPGVYAISASNLQGVLLDDPDTFDWFRHRQPAAKIGYSIFVYDVTGRTEGQWAAVCYAPLPALEADQMRDALAAPHLRLVYFDCRSGWVYPAGGGPGWYIVPGYSEGAMLTDLFLSDDRIVFRGRKVPSRPALAVYHWDAVAELSKRVNRLQAHAPHGVAFGQVAVFVGSEVDRATVRPGGAVTLTTYWRALSMPTAPLSIMAHLTDEEGNFVAGADGLGVTVENWQPEDILVQVHRFAVPPDTPPGLYVPRVGWYALGSLERVPLADGSGDSLALEPLQVDAP